MTSVASQAANKITSVKSEYPVVGVIGAGQLAQMMIGPATALGIKLIPFASSNEDSAAQVTHCVIGDYKDLEAVKKFAQQCDVVTFEHELVPLSIIKALEVSGVRVRPGSETLEHSRQKKNTADSIDFDYEIAVLVARSPHAQATTWAPTHVVKSDGICTMTITPVPHMSTQMNEQAQKIALDTAAEVKLIGVMEVQILVKNEELLVNKLVMHPSTSGYWSIDASRTSQFEQHLRAILDLPLGDPSMTNDYAVMGNIVGKNKTDMYRPYLHLMARNPSLKFHMYSKQVRPGLEVGHINAFGKVLAELQSEIEHAVDYMSGEIDE
jgi:phosphoribosylaminoimidazole carboxylase (NCAIR synthetase)